MLRNLIFQGKNKSLHPELISKFLKIKFKSLGGGELLQ